jgi:molecular chaperone GrpE
MTTEPQDEQNAENNAGGNGGANSGEELRSADFADLPLEEQVVALAESLAEAQREAAQNLDGALRAQAEMANYRKRTDEERIASAKYSNSRLIAKVLPVFGELDLAIEHGAQASQGDATGGPNDSWLEGVRLIQRKLNSVLESEGVTHIDTIGVAFDPLEHEAQGTEETADLPPGYITQTLRPGFKLHDRVIQPAQVMVARAPRDD